MATSPATAPAAAPTTLGLPLTSQLMPTQESAAAEAAVVVTVKALAATALAAPALPALKPNQPNQRMPVPSRIIVMSCGSIGSSLKPLRRPNMIAAASAAAPALRWMAVPPAKSRPFTSDGDPALECRRPSARPVRRPAATRHHEDAERAELRPLREGARDQRRRDDGEHELEAMNSSCGMPGPAWESPCADVLEPEVVEVANEPQPSRSGPKASE